MSSDTVRVAPATPGFELVCPAGSLPALKAAVGQGADCVYLGFCDATFDRITLKKEPIYHSTYTGKPPDDPPCWAWR